MTARIVPVITNTPISDRIIRERTFDIAHLRADRKDALAQIVITIDELLKEGFTGQIHINCSQGKVNNVQASQSQKI